MRRVTRHFWALGLTAALVLAPSGSAANGPTLAESGGTHFPSREFVLTLQEVVSLDPSAVEVLENGRAVSNYAILPASQAGGTNEFGVVLVIDASNSMRGKAILGALEAARSFALQRHAAQRLAVVIFNDEVTVLLPLTSNDALVANALANPPALSRATRLYDGVGRAISLLSAAKIRAGSIVVLSDGADTNSTQTPDKLAAAARAAHVRIFTVGLRSRAFRPEPLETMANFSGGRYVEAASATKDLPSIYGELATMFASEYIVRYRSLEGPDQAVRVEVRSPQFNGVATATYVTPKLGSVAKEPYHPSLGLRFWSSAAASVIVSAIIGALAAFALVSILTPRGRKIRERVGEFVSVALPQDKEDAGLPDRLFTGAENSLVRFRWWPRFKQELELARISMPAVQVVLWTVVATIFALWVFYLVSGSKLAAVFALGVPLVVRAAIKRRVERLRGRFAEQLPDNLQVLASALRAGHSLVGALSVVVDDAPDPARTEFQRVIADERLGIPLEESLLVVAERMENRDLEQVALVAALQRQTGGNTAEVLDHVSATIRERFELRRMVKTLTAQGRMSRWVVSLLPLGLLFAILAINPHYVAPLFEHTSGRVLVVLATIMVVTGSIVIGRIVKIKV
jgi:tight adherence protein B